MRSGGMTCFSFRQGRDLAHPTLDISYEVEESGTVTARHYQLDVRGVSTVSVATGLSFVTGADIFRTPSGTNALVVCGLDSGGASGGVVLVVDTDGDGIATDVRFIVGFGAGLVRPSSVNAVPKAGGSNKFYVFDDATDTIYNLPDSDGDGLPDELGLPFATPDRFSELADGLTLVTTGELEDGRAVGETMVAITASTLERHSLRQDDWTSSFRDLDGDDRADESTGKRFLRDHLVLRPALWSGAFVGEEELLVHGSPGHVVEVRAQDADGAFTVVLGSALTETETSRWGDATIRLARPLRLGETIQLRDLALGLDSTPIVVEKKTPRILSVAPAVGPRSGGTLVTITGQNFVPGSTVLFGDRAAPLRSYAPGSLVVESPPLGPVAEEDWPLPAVDRWITIVAPVETLGAGADGRVDASGWVFFYQR